MLNIADKDPSKWVDSTADQIKTAVKTQQLKHLTDLNKV